MTQHSCRAGAVGSLPCLGARAAAPPRRGCPPRSRGSDAGPSRRRHQRAPAAEAAPPPARPARERPPWGGCGRPGGGCCGGCGAPRGCGKPAGSTPSPAASSWGWAPPRCSSTGNRAGRRGSRARAALRLSHAAPLPSRVSVRYLHVLMIFWSFVAGVVTFYCSLGPDSLLPNILFTIKYQPKVNMSVKSVVLSLNMVRIYTE